MENHLNFEYSTQGKLKVNHRNCRDLTNEEIVCMLLSSQMQLLKQEQNKAVVEYPCCGTKDTREKLQKIMNNVCLGCNFAQNLSLTTSKIHLKNKSHTICCTCFEDLKKKESQTQIKASSLESTLIEILNKCCQCQKIIGYQNEIQNYGFEILCKQCHQSMEDDLEGQSEMNQSMNKTSESVRSIRSFFQGEQQFFPVHSSTPIQKSQHKTNPAFQKPYTFNRSQFEIKDKQELISIIEKLTYQIHQLQEQKLQQSMFPSRVDYRGEPNMLKSYRSFLSAKQPELNYSKVKIEHVMEFPVYEANPICSEQISSQQDESLNSDFEADSQINQSQAIGPFQKINDNKSNKTPSIGNSRYEKQTAIQIDKSIRDRWEQEQLLQSKEKIMQRSSLLSNRVSKQFEQQDTEDEAINQKQHKNHLIVTAPIASVSNKNNSTISHNDCFRNSLQ